MQTSNMRKWFHLAKTTQLGESILHRDSVVVFDDDLNRIQWSNVSGAELFGATNVGDFLGQSFPSSHPFIRQLSAACRQLDGEAVNRAFRVVSDQGARLLQCRIERIDIDDGGHLFCVTCANEKYSGSDEQSLAQLAVDAFGNDEPLALLDQYGLPLAANAAWAEVPFDLDSMEKEIEVALDNGAIQPEVQTDEGELVVLDLVSIQSTPGRLFATLSEDGVAERKPSNADDADTTIDIEDEELVTRLPLTRDDVPVDASSDNIEAPSLIPDEEQEEDVSEEEALSFRDSEMSPPPAPFRHDPKTDQVRFSWSTNPEQEFTSVSEELALAVGPNAAEIVGRKWRDVAQVFGFDASGEIQSLLERQDTWSGKCVAWPIQGTDLVAPVDLAALPSFSSGRNFDGFRGFGVVRMMDAIIDPDETGMALVSNTSQNDPDEDDVSKFAAHTRGMDEHDEDDADDAIALKDQAENEDTDDLFSGRRQDTDRAGNVVSLSARRFGNDESNEGSFAGDIENQDSADEDNDDGALDELENELAGNRDNGGLSTGENQAFNEIRRKLKGDGSDDNTTPERQAIDLEKDLQSQFAVPQEGDIQQTETSLDAEQKAAPDTTILDNLPFPILIFREGESLHANPEFFELTGHGNLADFAKDGGIDNLFAGDSSDQEGDSLVALTASDGSGVKVKAVVKSVPWDAHNAMMVTFRQPKHEQQPAGEKVALDMMRVSELENILDTATDGILILDDRGRVQSANQSAEALFGHSHDKIEGGTIYEMFASESHANIREYLEALTQPGVGSMLNDGREVIGIEANGGLIPLFITIGKVGESDKLCAVLRDITQWKKASEELVAAKKEAESASEQKTDFLARVSHEIRTPLNAIIGFSDVMIDERFGAIDNERYREYLRDINRSGVHVLELINDLLDISKIEAGKMELSFESVDLNKMVAETVALLQPQANGQQVLIRTSLSRAVPHVVADARSIRQIVLNLVSNAIKFTQANGQVIVSTVYEGNGEVALRIRDTGRGMSEEEITKAMKPFQQIDSISDKRGEGTGLGLPLTKALVEANKAYFDIESESDEGTIVHIQFPSQRVLAD